jgi:membrane protein involved in colicin uptake
MKIQFVVQHIVRGETRAEDTVFEKDQIVDFGKDRVANSYALAYIERGYAVDYDAGATQRAADDADAKAKDADAKAAKADADAKSAKDKADADAKAKADTAKGNK